MPGENGLAPLRQVDFRYLPPAEPFPEGQRQQGIGAEGLLPGLRTDMGKPFRPGGGEEGRQGGVLRFCQGPVQPDGSQFQGHGKTSSFFGRGILPSHLLGVLYRSGRVL